MTHFPTSPNGASLGYTGERSIQFDSRAANGSLNQAPSFVTLNLRAGAYLGRWNVELYGKNLTNDQGVTQLGEAGTLPNNALGLGLIRPRAVGLSVSTRIWGS